MDLGTQCGYAFNKGDFFESSTWSLATNQEITAWGKNRLRRRSDPRVFRLFDNVSELIASNLIDAIVFEDVQFSSSTYQTQLWSSLRAAVWLAAYQNSLVLVDCVATGTLKKFTTGHGNATKEMMINAVRHRFTQLWRNPKGDDNEADAVCIHQWAVVNLGRTKL